ncbi:hypothetical protein SHIRM173S_07123 [Streptomyces hirsutus]
MRSVTTTKAEKRAQAKTEYDRVPAVCPSRQLLDRISDKWVVLILCALGGDASERSGASHVPKAMGAAPNSPGCWRASARRC